MEEKKEWFASWFDNPYYHVLYKNRDFRDAEFFITNLLTHLNPPVKSSMLDLACGAGRHAIFLNKKGYEVTGVDLSPNSIEVAKKTKAKDLVFDTHDMREVYKENAFNYIFSMFTSFGYFSNEADNVKMLQSVEKGLKKEGVFVLDFLNPTFVIDNLVSEEVKEEDGVTFSLQRKIEDGFIKKNIQFVVDGQSYDYTEQVQAIDHNQMKAFFEETNLEIVSVFGDYGLNPFDEQTSKRQIIIARKK